MAELIVLYWRDIPAQVIARRSRREQVKHVLAERFAEAIDKAAMRSRSHDSDSYLQEWRKSSPEPCGDDLASVALTRAKKIEEEFDEKRLAELVANGGSAK